MGFRIVVRMTKFFTDERSFSYVYIKESLKTVNGLETYLAEMFNLKRPFCLMNENFLLPSCENIHIIRADEMITVNPIQSHFNFTDNGTSVSSQLVTKSSEEVVEKETKKKKRKKNKDLSQDFDIDEKSVNKENTSRNYSPDSPDESNIIDKTEGFTATKNIEEYHLKPITMNDEDEIEAMKSKVLSTLKDIFPNAINGVSDGRIQKRKRVRIRKSKKSNQVEYLQSDSDSTITQNKSLVITNGKISSHVRFNSGSEKPITILQNEIVSKKIDKNPRIVRAIQPEMIHSLMIPTVDSDFWKNKNVKTSRPSHIDNNNCSDESAKAEQSRTENGSLDLNNILKQLESYPIQYNMSLKPNDVIVFKMLKMQDDYSPVMSNFILGKVISCDNLAKSLKLSILEGQEECIKPVGKFYLEQDSLENDHLISDCIDLTWDQLLDPRITNK